MEKIYIVQTTLSSPNHILGTEEIDEVTSQVTYMFKKETRRKIGEVRTRHARKLLDNALDFYGLHLARKSQMPQIEAAVNMADSEMQGIDLSLHAQAIIIPIDMAEVGKGELYNQVMNAIRYRILSDIIDRLEIKSAQLPDKSKESIMKILDKLRAVNLFNEPEIEERITKIRESILNDDLATIRKSLQQELALLSKRGMYLEL